MRQKRLLEAVRHGNIFFNLLVESFKPRRILHELLLGDLVRRNIPRHTERADDAAVSTKKRHLAGRHPCDAAIRPDFLLFHPQHRLPGFNDPHFVLECGASMLLFEEIKVSPANQVDGVIFPYPLCKRIIHLDNARLQILEVDIVLAVIQQVCQQVAC